MCMNFNFLKNLFGKKQITEEDVIADSNVYEFQFLKKLIR